MKKKLILYGFNKEDVASRRRDLGSDEIAYDISSFNHLEKLFTNIIANGQTYRGAVFATHGNSGFIRLGDDTVSSHTLYSRFYNRGYNKVFEPNASIYFSGCNIAKDEIGWKFLFAAARCMLPESGGSVSAWTSTGYHNFISKYYGEHALHFFGDSRQVMRLSGETYRFLENWELLESGGLPQAPSGLENFFT